MVWGWLGDGLRDGLGMARGLFGDCLGMVWDGRENKRQQNKKYFDHNFDRFRRPDPILCQDLRTVRGKVLVQSGPERVGLKGVNCPYTGRRHEP